MYIIFKVRIFSKIGFTQSENTDNSTDTDCLPIRQKSARCRYRYRLSVNHYLLYQPLLALSVIALPAFACFISPYILYQPLFHQPLLDNPLLYQPCFISSSFISPNFINPCFIFFAVWSLRWDNCYLQCTTSYGYSCS